MLSDFDHEPQLVYEFAIDPKIVSKWHDRLEYLYFEEKFGPSTRRLVSVYPRNWKKRVWEHFKDSPAGCDQNAEKKLETIIADILANFIQRPSTFPNIIEWLARVETEAENRPFQAIITEKNPRSHSQVIELEKLISDGDKRWNIPDLKTVPRTPNGIAYAAKSTLQFCKKAVFVEPFFLTSKDKNLKLTFQNFFDYAWNIRPPGSDPLVEIQTKLPQGVQCSESKGIVNSSLNFLEKIVPSGKKLKLLVKKAKYGSQRFHNRYILTENIGLCLPSGLTHADSRRDESDDIYVLSGPQLVERWGQYVNASPSPFETIDEQIIIGKR